LEGMMQSEPEFFEKEKIFAFYSYCVHESM